MDKDENDIIIFGFDMMKMTAVAITVAVVVALVLGMFFEGVLFLASFIVLRQYAGGFHTKKEWMCAILSCMIYTGVLLIIKIFSIHNIIQLILYGISCIIIMILAPVDNENNELTDSEKKHLAKRMRFVLCFESAAFALLLVINLEYWSGIIAISILVVAILVLLGLFDNKSKRIKNVSDRYM